jgi:hypothetical protein
MMQAGDAIASGGQVDQTTGVTSPKLPSPSRFFASIIVFLFLAGLAAFGEGAAKFASRFGALVALVIVLAPPNPSQPIGSGNRPLVIRFLNLLNSYMIAGAVTQVAQAPQPIAINPATGAPANPGPAGAGTVLGPGVIGLPGGGGPTQINQNPVGVGGVA